MGHKFRIRIIYFSITAVVFTVYCALHFWDRPYGTCPYIAETPCPEYILTPKLARRDLGPPSLTDEEINQLDNFVETPERGNKELLGDLLSKIVQGQLKTLHEEGDCGSPNLLCGHFDYRCGFACQVHHRVGCLILSYALSLPLIHDEVTCWTFSKTWSGIFQPLGSKCSPGNNTYRWSWEWGTTALYRGLPCSTPPFGGSEVGDQIEYPLWGGIPVAKKLGDSIENLGNPYWLIGQFMKFALQSTEDFRERVETQKGAVGLDFCTVGFHVRRTDKVKEAKSSHHEIEEYIKAAEKLVKGQPLSPRNIFIASDDSQVLPQSQNRFPDWNIRGFEANETLWSLRDRVDSLDDIARDVLVLSECEYIVCGFSSNVCRLLLEMLSFKYLDSEERLKSLDGAYVYTLFKHTVWTRTLVKV